MRPCLGFPEAAGPEPPLSADTPLVQDSLAGCFPAEPASAEPRHAVHPMSAHVAESVICTMSNTPSPAGVSGKRRTIGQLHVAPQVGLAKFRHNAHTGEPHSPRFQTVVESL